MVDEGEGNDGVCGCYGCYFDEDGNELDPNECSDETCYCKDPVASSLAAPVRSGGLESGDETGTEGVDQSESVVTNVSKT